MRPSHVALAVLITALWGLNFVVIRIGIDNFPPLLFSAFRFSLAAIPLVFFIPRPKVAWRLIIGLGFVLGVVKFSLLFVGMDLGVSAGLASVILQSQAFFTVILAALVMHDTPTKMQMTGIAVAFSGIALIATTVDSNLTPTGLILVLAAGAAWAVYNLLLKWVGQVNMLHLMVWISLVPPLPLLILSMIFEGPEAAYTAISTLNWQGAGAVIFNAFVTSIFGFTIWGKLIHLYGPGKIAPFSLLVPIFGMSSAALILGESFGPVRLAATGLIVFGLILTVLKPSQNSATS